MRAVAPPVRRGVWMCLLAAIVPSACTDRPDVPAETRSFITRDSAGIEIVESHAPRFSQGSWRLSDAPIQACSAARPAPNDRIFQVQSVLPVEGDRLAILVQGTQELLLCDDGAVVSTLGGDGEGPGEFRSVFGMVPAPGDSIAVQSTSRITLFDLESGGFREMAHHQLLNGSVALIGNAVTSFVAVVPVSGDTHAEDSGPADLVYLDWSGGAARTLDSVPVRFSFPVRRSQLLWGAVHPRYAPDGYWLPSDDAMELTRYAGEGADRIIRAPWDPLPMTDLLREEAERRTYARIGAGDPAMATAVAERFGSIVAGDTASFVPPLIAVHPTAHGELWVRVPERDLGVAPQRWRIFGVDGSWLAEMDVPTAFRPLLFTEDRVYGVREDELGLESVEVYLIERGS